MHHLWAVAAAALVGFAGNELVARYRISIGRRIGSAALVADGLHARTDGFTSLAVLLGAGGVALGWRQADPIVGLLITIAILGVLRSAVTPGRRPPDGRRRPGAGRHRRAARSPTSRACWTSPNSAFAGSGTACAPRSTSPSTRA